MEVTKISRYQASSIHNDQSVSICVGVGKIGSILFHLKLQAFNIFDF